MCDILTDAGDAKRLLSSIIYVCKSIAFLCFIYQKKKKKLYFYVLGPSSLLGYYYFNLETRLFL